MYGDSKSAMVPTVLVSDYPFFEPLVINKNSCDGKSLLGHKHLSTMRLQLSVEPKPLPESSTHISAKIE